MPLDRRLAKLKRRKIGFYRRSTRLKRTTGLLEHQNRREELSSGVQETENFMPQQRTLRSETTVLSSRSRTFKRGKVAEIGIR
jgi:hypothetical protein